MGETPLEMLCRHVDGALVPLGEISTIVGHRIWRVEMVGDHVECWLEYPATPGVAAIKCGNLIQGLRVLEFQAECEKYGADGMTAPHVLVWGWKDQRP